MTDRNGAKPDAQRPHQARPLADLDAEIDFTDVIAFFKRWRFWLLGATICGACAGGGIWAFKNKASAPGSDSPLWLVTLEGPAGSEIALSGLPAAMTAALTNDEAAKTFYKAMSSPTSATPNTSLNDWLARQAAGAGMIRSITAVGRQIRVMIDSRAPWTQEQAQSSILAAVNELIVDFNGRFVATYQGMIHKRIHDSLKLTNQKAQALALFAKNSELPPAVNQEFIAKLAPMMVDDSKSLSMTMYLLGSLPDSEPKKASLLMAFNATQQDLQEVDGRLQLFKKTLGIDSLTPLPVLTAVTTTKLAAPASNAPGERLGLLVLVGALGGCMVGVALVVGMHVSAAAARLRSATV